MKINIVLNSYPIASETFLVAWINLLVKKGYKIRLILLNSNDIFRKGKNLKLDGVQITTKLNPLIIINGFKFIKINTKIKSIYYCSFFSIGSPQIVHFSYSSIAIGYIDIIKELQKYKIKFVVSCRGTSDNIKPYLDIKRKNKHERLFQVIDQVHCVSEEMLTRMNTDFGLATSKGYVNRPAIDISKFKFANSKILNSQIIIISTGRLEYVKGYIFAILAIKKLVSLGFNISYRIVGWGNDLEYLKFSVHKLEINEHVEFLGVKNSTEVIKEVSKAHLYLGCSLSEGISNAVIEAMSLGIPVISTDVGGMKEVVINNQTGKLVKPFSEDAIYKAILDCLNNSQQLEAMRTNARSLVESSFNYERLIDVFDFNYKKLIKYESSAF